MSSRTIVEFNHDFGHELFDKPEEFMRLIRRMINGGSSDAELRDALSRFGVTTTPTAHHSCKRVVSLTSENGSTPYFTVEW